MQISSDLNPPTLGSHRSKSTSVSLTNRWSKFSDVESPHAPQLRQPFLMHNLCQAFKNIISTSGWYENFSENPASRDYDVEFMRYVLSRILFVNRLVQNWLSINSTGCLNVIRAVLKRLSRTSLMNHKVGVGVRGSMLAQKAKSWPGLRRKQKI
jgi:hypothetical protein